MGRPIVIMLKLIIALALAGSLVVQGVLAPLLYLDVERGPVWFGGMVAAIVVLGVLCLQVIGVCIWRLLTRVRAGTVFSPASFREVDVIIGAIAAGAVLLAALGTGFAIANRSTEGDMVAPGIVGFILGLALVAAGFSLLVVIMRRLLVQAIALDSDARTLRAELEEVI